MTKCCLTSLFIASFFPHLATASSPTLQTNLLFVDGAHEIRLRELYPDSSKSIKAFSDNLASKNFKEADRVLRGMAQSDLREYLAAYRDSSQLSASEYAGMVVNSHHRFVYQLTGLKILIDERKAGGNCGKEVNQVYRMLGSVPVGSPLAYALKAEDFLVCDVQGLVAARNLYAQCVKKYGRFPVIWNREAELLESEAGYFGDRHAAKGSFAPTVRMVKPDLERAVQVREEIERRFPDYEPNYYFLANDFKSENHPNLEKRILADYLDRFGSSSTFYGRCHAMIHSKG